MYLKSPKSDTDVPPYLPVNFSGNRIDQFEQFLLFHSRDVTVYFAFRVGQIARTE